MNAGASTSAVPSPIEGSGTAWVLLGSWALSPARPTPIHPRHECRGFPALLVMAVAIAPKTKADADTLTVSLHTMAQEDPTFQVRTDEDIGHTIMAGMGELHVDIFMD